MMKEVSEQELYSNKSGWGSEAEGGAVLRGKVAES